MSWQNFLVEALLLAILEKRGGWNVTGRTGKSLGNGESSPNVGSIETSKTNGVTLLWLFRSSSEWKDLDSVGLGPTNWNFQIHMHVLIITNDCFYLFFCCADFHWHFLSLSSLPQRSYTLIVEAWDFNNETGGEYFFPFDIYVLPYFLFTVFWLSFWQHLGDIMLKVREGSLSFPYPTTLFLKIHRLFFFFLSVLTGACEGRKKRCWGRRGEPHCPHCPVKMFLYGWWLIAGAANWGRGHAVSLSLRRKTQEFIQNVQPGLQSPCRGPWPLNHAFSQIKVPAGAGELGARSLGGLSAPFKDFARFSHECGNNMVVTQGRNLNPGCC